MDATATILARSEIRSAILTCTSCPLHARGRGPVPFRGATPSRLMIIGEAPGRQEDKEGRPFVGASGKQIDRMLTDAELPPTSGWFVANSVCCWPDGTPQEPEIKACHSHLRAQIHLADPEWILTLGAVALKALGVKEAVSKIHGRSFDMTYGPAIGRHVFATFHPAAGLRDPAKLTQIAADLSTFRQVLDGTLSLDVINLRIGRGGKMFH